MVDNGCWANHGVNHNRLSREPGLDPVGGAREESRTPDLLITSTLAIKRCAESADA